MTSRVLLVEDSLEFQFLVKKVLENSCEVKGVSRALDARKELLESHYDLVLLDLGLPDEDGFNLCREIRTESKTKQLPLFILTGKNQIEAKVKGFDLGADDYIVKPFDPQEFKARVDAKIKRYSEEKSEKQSSDEIQIGNIALTVPNQKAFFAQNGTRTEIDLTPIEFKILYFLMKHSPEVKSRDALLKFVWSDESKMGNRIIDRHVCSLRQKLADFSDQLETIPRRGYRFKS